MIDLKFNQVSKKYNIRANGDSPKRWYRRGFAGRKKQGQMWALRNVSFQVNEGEALGIVGHNGAGKTTILKILSGITTPTAGEITIRGRLVALVEVSSGFHPELTGMENVYLHGAMLGMRRSEIRRKLESIVEFAGVGRYIEVPVKRYSSGMYLRLGFAISAHLDPDILLLDEVLAVGDAAFQSKCIERVSQMKRAGTTIIFVSHNLGAVESLCDRVLLLRQGRVAASGRPRAVITEYERMLAEAPTLSTTRLQDANASPAARIIAVTLFDAEGRRTSTFATGDPLRVEVEYLAEEPVDDAVFEVYFYSVFDNLH